MGEIMAAAGEEHHGSWRGVNSPGHSAHNEQTTLKQLPAADQSTCTTPRVVITNNAGRIMTIKWAIFRDDH